MTLVLSINGPDTIWMLTDRRISFAHRVPKDDARKVVTLETTDGVALLGYAGLGSTARGTEPADWMSAVLRGRNLPLEQCLGALAQALQRQFPKHLMALPPQFAAVHNIVVPAFVDGIPKLYSIDLVRAPDKKTFWFRHTRHVAGKVETGIERTPRLGLTGSGAAYLLRDKRWARELLRLVRASDREQIDPRVVADFLAELNNRVSLGTVDKSVGPRCIVVWRHRKDGPRKGGGAHQFYSRAEREPDSGAIPLVCNGLDLQAIFQAVIPVMTSQMAKLKDGVSAPELDQEALNAAFAKLPDKPDETLK